MKQEKPSRKSRTFNRAENAFVFLTSVLVLFSCASTLFFDGGLWSQRLEVVHDDPSSAIERSDRLLDYFISYRRGLPDFPEYTAEENAHLRDVRRLMHLTLFLLPIGWIAWCILLRKEKQKSLALFHAGLASFGWFVFALIPFPLLFILFHLVFFPQGNWMFPSDSLLLATYPSGFFLLMAKSLAARIFLVSSALIVVGKAGIIEKYL